MSLSDPKATPSVPNPVMVINGYLWDKFKEIDPGLDTYPYMPIFPMSDAQANNSMWDNKPYLIFNRMFQRPDNPFYPIKRDVYHYGLKASAVMTLEWSAAMQAILDRQDDAARDINAWNAAHGAEPVYFHNLRVYQMEQGGQRDYTNRPTFITDIIVKAEYHITKSLSEIIS